MACYHKLPGNWQYFFLFWVVHKATMWYPTTDSLGLTKHRNKLTALKLTVPGF